MDYQAIASVRPLEERGMKNDHTHSGEQLEAMRRQAQDELTLAIANYQEIQARTSTKLYACSRLVAVYVAHGLLSERELRERFFDAARELGDIEKFGAPWAALAVRGALNDATSDPLPPLKRDYEVAA